MSDRLMELALKCADAGARAFLDGESTPFFVGAPNDPYELGMYWLRSDSWGDDHRPFLDRDAVKAACKDCYEYLSLRNLIRVHAERPELFVLVDAEDGCADNSSVVPMYDMPKEAVAYIRTRCSNPAPLVAVAEDAGLTFYTQDADGKAQGEPLARVRSDVPHE